MIDLHLHTTASDGRYSPTQLVQRVRNAGVSVFAITDHDTVAGHAEAAAAARVHGLEFVPGIEITAVWGGRDVHVLGYWIDGEHAGFNTFLAGQRDKRGDRIAAIVKALWRLNAGVDYGELMDEVKRRPGASIGRPAVARALVAAGKASSVQDAFDRYLGEGKPAFVPRSGVTPLEVIEVIHNAGGVASLAHPGVSRCDDQIANWARGGLDALEAYHSDHDEAARDRYLERAESLGLAVSGGSDFHGEDSSSDRSQRRVIGGVTLPADAWTTLQARGRASRR